MSDKTKYILSLYMAFNILIASIGINVFKHSCQALQTTSLSTFAKEAACCCSGGNDESMCKMPQHQADSQNKDTSNPDDDCCTDEITTLKAETFVSKFKVLPLASVGILPSFSVSFGEVAKVLIKENTTAFADSSPPISGQQQIILHQAFLL